MRSWNVKVVPFEWHKDFWIFVLMIVRICYCLFLYFVLDHSFCCNL